VVLSEWQLAAPKTKEVAAKLRELSVSSAVVVVEGFDDPIFLAARNLPNVDVATAASVDPVSLVGFEHVVCTEAALRRLEERFA
jgi:large subunit ribosomal protein L4